MVNVFAEIEVETVRTTDKRRFVDSPRGLMIRSGARPIINQGGPVEIRSPKAEERSETIERLWKGLAERLAKIQR